MHEFVEKTNASDKLSSVLSLFFAEAMRHGGDTLVQLNPLAKRWSRRGARRDRMMWPSCCCNCRPTS